jgi:methionyl-tRNA formyltransferase
LVLQSVGAIEKGNAPHVPQDDSRATFAPLIHTEDTLSDWSLPAHQLHNRIRGLSPEPAALALCKGKRVHLLKSAVHPGVGGQPGEIIQLAFPPPPGGGKRFTKGLWVSTGEGILEILLLRPENKGSISGRDYLNGARLKVGDRFENGAMEL